jgi:hypothetical protein
MHDQIIFGSYTTLINLSLMAYKETTKQKKRERGSSYYHYSSPTLLGGPRATDRGALGDRDSEARWVRGPESFHLILSQIGVIPGPQ